MKTILPTLSIARIATLFCLLGAVALSQSTATAAPITVQLKSGRTFTAEIDAKTNQQQLWLRFGNETAILLRPIDWQRVVSAQFEGKKLTAEQLRQQADQLKTVADPLEVPAPQPENKRAPGEASFAQQAQEAMAPENQITSVTFDAFLANWDGDVEADGLVVQLRPLSFEGHAARVSGVLEVELFAAKSRRFSEVPQGRGWSPTRIGRWSAAVTPEQIGPNGLTLKLPFQADHPEFNKQVGSHGLVHVRFVVPGHGVFEHSQDAVRIRPFAPMRDSLYRNKGQYFLPNERTGRGKRNH